MALPPKLASTFLPSELFFLAEDTQITIVSRQALDPIQLIGLKTPPLRLLQRAKVPLWFACILKKQARCNLVLPSWLEESSLRTIYDQELRNPHEFNDQLPPAWLEISQMFLDVARDDLMAPANVIRGLIRDLREVRQAKARAGIKELNESHMRMDNMGTLELNELRQFMAGVMDELQRLIEPLEEAGEEREDEDMDDDNDLYE